jgi:hypothetical protein
MERGSNSCVILSRDIELFSLVGMFAWSIYLFSICYPKQYFDTKHKAQRWHPVPQVSLSEYAYRFAGVNALIGEFSYPSRQRGWGPTATAQVISTDVTLKSLPASRTTAVLALAAGKAVPQESLRYIVTMQRITLAIRTHPV